MKISGVELGSLALFLAHEEKRVTKCGHPLN